MSTIEINKIAGAVLMAILIALGLSFIVELTTAGHQDEAEPVFTVDTPETEPTPIETAGEDGESLVALLAAADVAKGEKAFKQCTACHSPEAGAGHKIGPNLWGVVGALKARHEDFGYSGVLTDLGGWWTFGSLDDYLTNPRAYAPGNKMAFAGVKSAEKRAALLIYLRSLSDDPVPLPTSEIEAEEGATKSTIAKMAREGRQAAEAAVDATVEMTEQAAEATAEMAEDASEMAADASEVAGEMAADAAAAVGAVVSDLVDRIANADLSAGEKIFKKCKACHSTEQGGKHKIGPNLWDIVGGPQARHDDFKYSANFSQLGGEWDYDALDAFFTKPADYVKGTKMAFAGIKDEGQRAEVIAYLRSLSDAPAPLE
jgi:cytochrome c